jgi:antitoxin component of RelBE/YafQ-DinJ toxin-antitoxin module
VVSHEWLAFGPIEFPHLSNAPNTDSVGGLGICSTYCATLASVSRSIHVRLDDSSAAALEVVRAEAGLTDSDAIRTALREAAARRRVRSAVREEVRALAADKHDREEMRVIREQLAELAPEPSG